MANADLLLKLGKVIIATAWADGEITPEETLCLHDIVFSLPTLTTEQWRQLKLYVDQRVDAAERERLIVELEKAIRSEEDKQTVIHALQTIITADGTVSPDEERAVATIQQAVERVDVDLMNQLGGLVNHIIDRRVQVIASAPNREAHFDEFIKNRVYYEVDRFLSQSTTRLEIPDKEVRKLCLAGGLMTCVAKIDRQVTGSEFDAMVRAMKTGWDVPHDSANFVAAIAVSNACANLDYLSMTRQFYETTTDHERLRFLDVLFMVADADGRVSVDESDSIRRTALLLKLTPKQFLDARVRIPRERRAD